MASGAHYHYESMRSARLLGAAAVLVVFVTVAAITPLAHDGRPFDWLALVVLVLASFRLAWLAFDNAGDAGLLFEYHTRRKFKAVCREKNLAKIDVKTGRHYFPRCSELIGGGGYCSIIIRPLLGQSVADWERAAEAFAMAFGVFNVRFTPLGDRKLKMHVGQQPLAPRDFVPVRYEPNTGCTWRERLGSVPVGFTENGGTYLLPLIGSHTLIAGITGAGKGSVIWSLILGLERAIEAGVVVVWGFDPKVMELSIGRAFFGNRYASDPIAIINLLQRAHDDMKARAQELSGKARRFEPSERHPLHVLVVDELAYLTSWMPDRKLRQQADELLQSILGLGRSVGYCVVAAVQDPRKEIVNYRDMFPNRIAMKLTKEMVDLILGKGAYEAGAACDAIPPREAGAGVAFVVREGETVPLCVRMPWCSDDLIKESAARIGDGGGAAPLPIGA